MLAIHPRGMFERLLGATTLSATYDTLCPFSSPQRAVLAPNGLIYVSDSGNNRIQALTPDGSLRFEWGHKRCGHGALVCPLDLAIVHDSLYVADSGHGRVARRGRLVLDCARQSAAADCVGESVENVVREVRVARVARGIGGEATDERQIEAHGC